MVNYVKHSQWKHLHFMLIRDVLKLTMVLSVPVMVQWIRKQQRHWSSCLQYFSINFTKLLVGKTRILKKLIILNLLTYGWHVFKINCQYMSTIIVTWLPFAGNMFTVHTEKTHSPEYQVFVTCFQEICTMNKSKCLNATQIESSLSCYMFTEGWALSILYAENYMHKSHPVYSIIRRIKVHIILNVGACILNNVWEGCTMYKCEEKWPWREILFHVLYIRYYVMSVEWTGIFNFYVMNKTGFGMLLQVNNQEYSGA